MVQKKLKYIYDRIHRYNFWLEKRKFGFELTYKVFFKTVFLSIYLFFSLFNYNVSTPLDYLSSWKNYCQIMMKMFFKFITIFKASAWLHWLDWFHWFWYVVLIIILWTLGCATL